MTQENISFSKENTNFVSELRDTVKEYFKVNKISKKGNWSIIPKTLIMLSLYLGPYFLMLFGVFTSVPLIILGWITMGVGMAGLGMVFMHDANHGTYSRNKNLNKWLGKSLYLLGGFPPNWRHQHNTLHHGFTNIEGQDEDIESKALLRLSPHTPLWSVHRFQHIYAWFFYCLMTVSWITMKDFKQLSRYSKSDSYLSSNKTYNVMLFDIIVSKILYYLIALVIPLLFISVAWYWIVLSFVLMHFTAGLILSLIFQTAHVVPTSTFPMPDKNGKLENNWAIHQLYTTADYSRKSKILSWFIGGLNYQVEHHLFPNISHVHYKKLAVIVQEMAEKYDLPYIVQGNFFKAIGNHYRMLKILGR